MKARVRAGRFRRLAKTIWVVDAGKVQIKDLILGAKIAETATLEEWKDRPSQFEAQRSDLVAEVRKVLDQQ